MPFKNIVVFLQVAQSRQAISSKLLKYEHIIEDRTYDGTLENQTITTTVFKSEAWFNGRCDSLCPGNCTGDTQGKGGKSEWTYIQKASNPAIDDQKILDLSLRTVCKGNIH